MIKRAYCRYLGEYPESANTSVAEFGFQELGIKCIPFYGFGDIETDVDCGPEALVHGFVGDVHAAMQKMGLPVPPSIDYPSELAPFYGRKIWEGTLEEIQDKGLYQEPGVFVKPRGLQKLFTGFLWKGTRGCRLYLAPYAQDTPCFFSEPVNFVSEYRCYVLDGEIVGVKHYKGDWAVAPSRAVVESAVDAYQPYRAYVIDFGVLDSGKTVVVEVNDAFALGNYGLRPREYALMIEARWEELTAPILARPTPLAPSEPPTEPRAAPPPEKQIVPSE